MSAREPVRGTDRSAPVRMPVPPMFLVLSSVAMLFLGAGACGLLSPELVPPLANPAVAWSLVGVGVMLDVAAAFILVSARRQRR